jgi:hypothetical protein
LGKRLSHILSTINNVPNHQPESKEIKEHVYYFLDHFLPQVVDFPLGFLKIKTPTKQTQDRGKKRTLFDPFLDLYFSDTPVPLMAGNFTSQFPVKFFP